MLEFTRVDHHADVGIWHANGTLPYFEQVRRRRSLSIRRAFVLGFLGARPEEARLASESAISIAVYIEA
jgi:hypothetical protein